MSPVLRGGDELKLSYVRLVGEKRGSYSYLL